MVLRKKTIDNSVRYLPKSEQYKEKDIKPNTIKNISSPRKQSENLSLKNKKSLKTFQYKDLVSLKE